MQYVNGYPFRGWLNFNYHIKAEMCYLFVPEEVRRKACDLFFGANRGTLSHDCILTSLGLPIYNDVSVIYVWNAQLRRAI